MRTVELNRSEDSSDTSFCAFFLETVLCVFGQISDFDEMTVVALRTPAGRKHDLCPCHRPEVAELRQDLGPPHLGGCAAPTPRPLKVRSPEGPYDCLAIMERGVATGSSARLLAARWKNTRLRLFHRPSGHGRRYRLP